jgi:hypothetical protein
MNTALKRTKFQDTEEHVTTKLTAVPSDAFECFVQLLKRCKKCVVDKSDYF